jgi:hypothetical protein
VHSRIGTAREDFERAGQVELGQPGEQQQTHLDHSGKLTGRRAEPRHISYSRSPALALEFSTVTVPHDRSGLNDAGSTATLNVQWYEGIDAGDAGGLGTGRSSGRPPR